MATKRKPKTRKEELRSSSPVRRSPRLSAKHSYQQPEIYSHQLHFTASSRQSLNPHGRSSRSATPSTILDESGQSVPPSFENLLEDSLSTGHVDSAHLRVREIQDRTGMPKHLYGLDYVEETSARVPESQTDMDEEKTPRIWHKYDKERLYVTTTPPRAPTQQGQSSIGWFVSFCSSILFKLGSLMYLASTAVMCLDVIILHRLFNVSSSVSQIGSVLRFFILLLTLVTLGGFLLVGSKDISPEEINDIISHSLGPFQTDIDRQINESVQSFRDSSQQDLKEIVKKSLEAYRRASQEEIDKKIENSLKEYKDISQKDIDLLVNKSLGSLPTKQDIEEMIKKSLETYKGVSQEDIDKMVNRSLDGYKGLSQEEIDSMVEKSFESLQQDVNRMVSQSIQASKQDIQLIVEQFLQTSQQYVDDMVQRSMEPYLESLDDKIRQLINQSLQDHIDTTQKDIHQLINQVINESLQVYINMTNIEISQKDIHRLINQSLKAFDADKIGTFDFILENSGGSVMHNHCSSTYSHSVAQISLFGFTLWHIPSSPKVIIQPSLYPGDCWAMEGQSGFATVKMSSKAVVTAITLDHIPRELTPNGSLSSAPKDFSVYGLADLKESGVLLGNFTYDLEGPTIQQYKTNETYQDVVSQYIRFEFISNHGNKDYTCIYRVRVHGHYP